MARVSKKAINQTNAIPTKQGIFQTALYIRISVEDVAKNIEDTLENQESLLRTYVKERREFQVVKVYCDRGKTGTNFARPAFEQLLEDVKSKKINAIIVKDLSRFGRNYIETGNYLETVFPFLGVRFLAINDHYDSFQTSSFDDVKMHLLNLANDFYAKDISQKIKTAFRTKQLKGECVSGALVYGYQLDPQDKNKIIIDEVTAPIVREIFEMKAEGKSYRQIATYLEECEILTPQQYKKQQKNKEYRPQSIEWKFGTIQKMVANEMYIGTVVHGKKGRVHDSNGIVKIKPKPKEEWVIIPDNHEAIVSNELFDKVNKIMVEAKQKRKESMEKHKHLPKKENLFKKIMVCEHCGWVLLNKCFIKERADGITIRYGYICANHMRDAKKCPFAHTIEEKIDPVITEVVRQQILQGVQLHTLSKSKTEQEKRELEELGKKKRGIQGVLQQIVYKKNTMYDDYVEGILGKNEYQLLQNRCIEEEKQLEEEIKQLEEDEEQIKKREPIRETYLQNLLQFKEETILTKEMVTALIEKIVVSSDAKIKIYFRYEDEYKKANQVQDSRRD